MDFYNIFDENQEGEGKRMNTPLENGEVSGLTESSNDSTLSEIVEEAKSVVSGPVRWDFKAVLQKDLENENAITNSQVENVNEVEAAVVDVVNEVEVVSEVEIPEVVAESVNSGDEESDREWAEMLAQEEAQLKQMQEVECVQENELCNDEVVSPVIEEEFSIVAEIEEPIYSPEMIVEETISEEVSLPVSESNKVVVEESAELGDAIDLNDFELDEVEMNYEENVVLNGLEQEEFVPISLAGDASEIDTVSVAPVFVNVEHSWMYVDTVTETVTEIGAEIDFQSSLPGELPLFNAENTTEYFQSHTNTLTQNNLKSEEDMKFELPEYSSIIKVIGVGGGGSNAVNHMYKFGIKGVDFLVCNTDKQALDLSPVPHKIVLGATLTEGRGAGSIPEVGRNAAIENIEDLRQVLAHNTKMVFITAGMGGGTGTGAAPVIAGVARELGILTVGIVTVPFAHEGKKRRQYAEEGIEQLKQNVDTLLVIRNDKLREMYGNLKLSDAFAHADDVLTTAAKSIAEIISLTQQINVDFADICTVMKNSGVAIMGSAVASGENRAVRAVEMSLNSPLLNDNNIIGARYVLLNIVSGSDEITMDELGEITDYIQEAAGQTAEIIKGYGVDPSLGESVSVTIIATGFQQTSAVHHEYAPKSQPEKVVLHLDENKFVEAPKVEKVEEIVESELNPLEPFLVSKQTEPVAIVTPEVVAEVKEEFIVPNPIEFEVVSTSQEIIEPVAELTDSSEIVSFSSIVSLEETVAEEFNEPVLLIKETVTAVDPIEATKKAEQEEIQRRANDRIQKLRDISLKLKTPQVLNEMENEPAYKRRNVALNNVPHSSESQVSRFTLTETDEKKAEIRPNNSFLHDNVD